MKKFMIAVLAISMSLVGCGQATHKLPPGDGTLEHPAHTPATVSLPKQGLIQDVLAGSYDRWYRITLKIVPKVGSQYGVISSGTSQGPGGIISDALRPGTKLYTIPGFDPTKQTIAVSYDGKYYEADLVPASGKNLGWIHFSNGYYSVSIQPADNIGKLFGVVGRNYVTASVLPDGTKLFAINNVPPQDPHGVGAIAVQTQDGSYVTAFWFGGKHP